jgi:hypothetical protein
VIAAVIITFPGIPIFPSLLFTIPTASPNRLNREGAKDAKERGGEEILFSLPFFVPFAPSRFNSLLPYHSDCRNG